MNILTLFALSWVFVLQVNSKHKSRSHQDLCVFDINYRDRSNFRDPNRCEKSRYLFVEQRFITSLHWCIVVDNRMLQFETFEYVFSGINTNSHKAYKTKFRNITSDEFPRFIVETTDFHNLTLDSIRLNGEEMCNSAELPNPNDSILIDNREVPGLMISEHLKKCQSRVNRTGTQCDNLNGTIVEKLRLNDEKTINCVYVDRTNSLLKNRNIELFIRVDSDDGYRAVWAGSSSRIHERSNFQNYFAFNLTSDRFFFVFHSDEYLVDEMIQIKLNEQITCGQFINITETKINYTCGARKIKHRGFITFGSATYHGKYPWHAAIYRLTPSYDSSTYICGGNIISTNAILTAAHCIQNSNGITTPYMLRVQLAKYDLSTFNSDSREHGVAEVIPHSDYDKEYFENDIAILKLVTYITYSNYIQPVCINDNREHEAYINEVGFVPGWGKNEHKMQHMEMHEGTMPIVDEQECRRSKRNFFPNFLNSRKFCAGFRNGTSVCGGDSGGGLVFELNGTWHLKGLVSLGVSNQNLGCDIVEYVLFTDVTKYVGWINNTTSAGVVDIKKDKINTGKPKYRITVAVPFDVQRDILKN